MTPDEHQMILDLFQRLASQGRVAKDQQADRVIMDGFRANPDAGYLLVQTALVYEQQMAEQDQRIRDLENQLAQDQSPAGGGSFLGSRAAPVRGSVPPVAASAPQGSPWGQPQADARAAPTYAPQPSPQMAAPQAPGFFRSALQTAAGVAGGMMVANSLGSLFGGHEAHAAGQTGADQSAALRDADATQDELQDAQLEQDAADDAATDADFDAGGSDGIDT